MVGLFLGNPKIRKLTICSQPNSKIRTGFRGSQALPALIRKALRHPKEEFSVWGSGRQYRDFVYVDDVVDALLLVLERGMDKGVIQIGSGVATRLGDAASVIARIVMEQRAGASGDDEDEGPVGLVPVIDCKYSFLSQALGERGGQADCEK